MVLITKTTQLNTFSMIRTALLANSTISAKFTATQILEFEPKIKGSSFNKFPYIVVRGPENPNEDGYLGNELENRNFNIDISLVMDYFAKDKYTGFANAIINALNTGESSYKESGYDYIGAEATGPPVPVTESQKDLLVGDFIMILNGDVEV